jgi:N-formylglutamate deformylase
MPGKGQDGGHSHTLRIAGDSPLVISLPHGGTHLPADIAARMTPLARTVPDTDWHVGPLYGFARTLGASWLEARLSRYVVDLNRPPDDGALYPGQLSTGLCPTHTFEGEPLYAGAAPDAAELARRRELYWAPYHAALGELVAVAQARHGYAILFDAHSIASSVPRLFTGRLPDLNVGTFDGQSCDTSLATTVTQLLGAQQRFSHVLNGRFKGGYITRAYGQPQRGVHAIQLEIARSAYMDESGTAWEPARAEPLQSQLRELLRALLTWRPPGASAHR